MSSINLPNTISGGQTMDPRPIQANFDEVERFVNADVVVADGTKAMTGNLTLSGPGTAAAHAVNKDQLDAVIATAVTDAATAASATTAAISTASADATTKADAAAVLGTADAKTYTDSVKVYTGFTEDLSGVTSLYTGTTRQLFLDSGNITPTKAGHAIITVQVDITVNQLGGGNTSGVDGIDAFIGELYVDGALNAKNIIWHPQLPRLGERQTMSSTWIVARPTADTFDVKFYGRDTNVGAGGRYELMGGPAATSHSWIQCLMVG